MTELTSRPRILFFSQNACWPLDTGAKLRNFHLLRGLARFARVTLLGFSDQNEQSSAEPPAELRDLCEQVLFVPKPPTFTLVNIIRGAIGPTPLTLLNLRSSAMAESLQKAYAERDFAAVHVGTMFLASYLPILRQASSRPLVVCDWHNVDSEILWRHSEQTASRLRRIYARLTARRQERVEKRGLRTFDFHLTVSDRDRAQLHAWSPEAKIVVIENGVDASYYADEEVSSAWRAWRAAAATGSSPLVGHEGSPPHRQRVLFVGSMDYHANEDAVLWFARQVWPDVHRRRPQWTFTVVGRRPPPEVRCLAELPGIEVTGTVPDVRPYYAEALACVVPLRVGGGSRLKITESMAAGVPVVSTRLGAEGLAVVDGEHLLLAEDSAQFAAALSEIAENDDRAKELVKNGRVCVQGRYDWEIIGQAVRQAYAEQFAARTSARND